MWQICKMVPSFEVFKKLSIERRESPLMKTLYCKKHEEYVSKTYCEFFNEGKNCPFYSEISWNSIKELLQDVSRPKWEVTEVIKPFKCSLLSHEALLERSTARRVRVRAV